MFYAAAMLRPADEKEDAFDIAVGDLAFETTDFPWFDSITIWPAVSPRRGAHVWISWKEGGRAEIVDGKLWWMAWWADRLHGLVASPVLFDLLERPSDEAYTMKPADQE